MTESVAGRPDIRAFDSRVDVRPAICLDAVQVTKPDGRIFVYYVLPSLYRWEFRKRKIRKAAFRSIRELNEPPGGTYVAMYELTRKRGWRPCPPL